MSLSVLAVILIATYAIGACVHSVVVKVLFRKRRGVV